MFSRSYITKNIDTINHPLTNIFGDNHAIYPKNKELNLAIQAKVANNWKILINAYLDNQLEKFNIQPKKIFSHQKIIWQYWGQGLDKDELPELIKICFNSVDKYKENYIVIRLDDSNIDEYLDLPNFVYQKRLNPQFNHTHFSDLLRLALLKAYGGIWLDAKILLTDSISSDLTKENFFMFYRSNNTSSQEKNIYTKKNPFYFNWAINHKVNLLNSFIISKKNNKYTDLCLNLLLNFWKTQNSIPHYFFFQILFDVLLEKNLITLTEKMVAMDDVTPHILQFKLQDTFNQQDFDIIKSKTPVHKLGYINCWQKNSFYDHLLHEFSDVQSSHHKDISTLEYIKKDKFNDISIVTAFFDINRGSWGNKSLKRTTDDYFSYFSNLAKLENEMIVFTSEKFQEKILALRGDRKTIIINIDFETHFQKYRDKVSKIQTMEIFKSKINPLQIHNPEYWSPDYVLITNLKSFFVTQAIKKQLVSNTLVAWIDFGCCRTEDTIDATKQWSDDFKNFKYHWAYNFNKDKFHLFNINYIYKNITDSNDVYNCIFNNIVSLAGAYAIASQEKWQEFCQKINDCQNELLDNSIVDDDQGILLMCYQKNKDFFQINYLGENQWFSMFNRFSEKIII